jgi:hypothetical protein
MTDQDPIGESLGVTSLVQSSNTSTPISELLNASNDNTAYKDFEISRANLRTLIDGGKDAFDKLRELAEQSQHPRAYEVLAKMLDSLVQANMEYLGLQQQIRDINDPGKQIGHSVNQSYTGPRTVNQTAIFVGSTADLQKAIKQSMKFIDVESEPVKNDDDS